MSPDVLFQIANSTALLGWAVLLVSPLLPGVADRVSGFAIPILLSIAYAGLTRLFQTRELLLAGWIHYLAFDLFVGAWIVRTARRDAMPFLLIVPCLALTFLFGPAGLLTFLAIRLARTGTLIAA